MNQPLSIEEARERMYRTHKVMQSFDILDWLHDRMPEEDWWTLVREGFRNDGYIPSGTIVAKKMKQAPREILDRMMSEDEQITFEDLEDGMPIYRACLPGDTQGLAWCLEPAEAILSTTTNIDCCDRTGLYARLSMNETNQFYLVRGKLNKRKAIYTEKCGPGEIIQPHVTVIGKLKLPKHPEARESLAYIYHPLREWISL